MVRLDLAIKVRLYKSNDYMSLIEPPHSGRFLALRGRHTHMCELRITEFPVTEKSVVDTPFDQGFIVDRVRETKQRAYEVLYERMARLIAIRSMHYREDDVALPSFQKIGQAEASPCHRGGDD